METSSSTAFLMIETAKLLSMSHSLSVALRFLLSHDCFARCLHRPLQNTHVIATSMCLTAQAGCYAPIPWSVLLWCGRVLSLQAGEPAGCTISWRQGRGATQSRLLRSRDSAYCNTSSTRTLWIHQAPQKILGADLGLACNIHRSTPMHCRAALTHTTGRGERIG